MPWHWRARLTDKGRTLPRATLILRLVSALVLLFFAAVIYTLHIHIRVSVRWSCQGPRAAFNPPPMHVPPWRGCWGAKGVRR